MEEIINRVTQSGLVTLNLEDYYQHGERVEIDIKENLHQGMVLKEKDFREFIKENDWKAYKDKFVAMHCSTDAIIPTWAYMLMGSALEPYAARVVYGDLDHLERYLFQEKLSEINAENFRDKKIVIKGCGHLKIPDFAFVELTQILRPFAKSIMYGEPCSTVPIYKKSK